MSRAFASGTYALYLCDRCGMRGRYADSVKERETGLRVHERCLDEPLRPWRARNEPQALRDPRPDRYEPAYGDPVWTADSGFYTADNASITTDGRHP